MRGEGKEAMRQGAVYRTTCKWCGARQGGRRELWAVLGVLKPAGQASAKQVFDGFKGKATTKLSGGVPVRQRCRSADV